MRKVMKEIFVGTWKMIMKVFLRKKILGDISVEYLGNISGKNLKGVTEEIFVGYFEEDFGENIDHYNLFVDFNLQTNILKRNLKFILNLERVWEISRFELLGCYTSEGSSVGCSVDWPVVLHRGVGGWCHRVSPACLFSWCFSGNNKGHDGSYPCAVQWVSGICLSNAWVTDVPQALQTVYAAFI
jgi:hypothetical protein